MITSASQLERVQECPASAVLPRAAETSPDASRGIDLHAFFELCASHGREKALQILREKGSAWLEVCEAIDTDLLPLELAHEVAFAYDIATDTARELGRGIGRKYDGLGPFEIPGTVDVAGVSDFAVIVGDYKTGWGEVTAAKDNSQLRFLALAAARTYERDDAIIEIIRPKENGTAWRDRAELDVFDLMDIADSLRSLPGRVDRQRIQWQTEKYVDVSQGPWCKYCPAFHSCPAKQALAIRLGSGEEITVLNKALTRDKVGQAWTRLKAAKELLGKVEKTIYAMAIEEPIDLGDGRMLGQIVKDGNEKLDGDVVHAVMRDRFPALADTACKRTATKKSIQDALRTIVPKVAPEMRIILGDIRDRGGSERPQRKVVEEYTKPERS